MRNIFPFLFCALALLHLAPARAADEPADEEEDVGEIVVSATRSRRLVRDQAMRVEVVPQEELEESKTVAPGNLTNLLNELAGARMDANSASLGGTSLRLRGMPGRHAQILSDGLALAGAQSDAFSFLQMPPIDLRRVEVIKGAASALYGGSALAGVVNLVSRAPDSPSELLASQSSLGASDLDLFIAHGAADRGVTFTGSANYQDRRDPDHDGWAELPGYERLTARPRFWWGDDANSLFGTIGFVGENRDGGSDTFPASLDTRHLDGGISGHLIRGDRIVDVKAYAVHVAHDRRFGNTTEDDASTSAELEASTSARHGAHDVTVGAALQYDSLSTSVRGVHYSYAVPAAFVQDEFTPAKWLEVAASARVDVHREFGTFVSPRISALFRLRPDVSLRASAGTGYDAATPQVEELEDAGFAPLNPLRALRAERASSGSLDLQWIAHPFDVNASVFASEIRHPLDVVAAQPGRVELVNADRPQRVKGAELLTGLVLDDLHLLFNSTWLDADDALLPGFTAEIATIWEFEGRGRAGFELGYTGSQRVEDDPYRSRSPSYVELNALAELRVGHLFVFLNAFDVTGVKQQDTDPLLRPALSPGLGGNPVTDAWAPVVGRWFSAGVRMKF
jgi:outer membrane receptor for ferrienterochelin and colicins